MQTDDVREHVCKAVVDSIVDRLYSVLKEEFSPYNHTTYITDVIPAGTRYSPHYPSLQNGCITYSTMLRTSFYRSRHNSYSKHNCPIITIVSYEQVVNGRLANTGSYAVSSSFGDRSLPTLDTLSLQYDWRFIYMSWPKLEGYNSALDYADIDTLLDISDPSFLNQFLVVFLRQLALAKTVNKFSLVSIVF
jgi:hypothetical protein